MQGGFYVDHWSNNPSIPNCETLAVVLQKNLNLQMEIWIHFLSTDVYPSSVSMPPLLLMLSPQQLKLSQFLLLSTLAHALHMELSRFYMFLFFFSCVIMLLRTSFCVSFTVFDPSHFHEYIVLTFIIIGNWPVLISTKNSSKRAGQYEIIIKFAHSCSKAPR